MAWNLPEQVAESISRNGRELQLNRKQSGAAVEAGAIGEQQLKRMQSGSS